jgi:YD repeat-containing protein
MKQISLALLLVLLSTASAFAQKNQSDREFQGFRGSVIKVTVERAELKQSGGTAVEARRQRQKMLVFDTEGNLVSDKGYYPPGVEFDVRTYSVIDGERVVKHEVFTKFVPPGIGTPNRQSDKPRDSRYTAKLRYQYDSQGNRTEMAWIATDARLTARYVYKREADRKEVMVYRQDGSLNYGYVNKLDDKGNELETTEVWPGYPPRFKTTYTYLEFDSQGNWIKRKEAHLDSSSIQYRKITYQ